MARCSSCSAPLKVNQLLCQYCGVRNDLNLHGRLEFEHLSEPSSRICPSCECQLEAIDLKIQGQFLIERCQQCFGLFFDPGQIDVVLEQGVSHAQINHQLLQSINEQRRSGKQAVVYRKCPECRAFMARRAFAYRSGVIIDRCPQHGVWLDNGELIHLLEWKKAGGEQLHRQRTQTEQSNQQQAQRSADEARKAAKPDLEDLFGDALSTLAKDVFR